MRIDLHTHSNVSDGTDSPTQLVHKAQAQGLDVIALCDHDTFDGVMEAREAAKRVGIVVITGLEMSCKVGDTSVHLLGYGCDPFHRGLMMELAKVRLGRRERILQIAELLTEAGKPVTEDEILEAGVRATSIGRPHVADAMVAKGYVADRKEAFENWIAKGKPAYVPRYATRLEDGIDLIHAAGGVAFIAHPWSPRDGGEDIFTAEYLQQLRTDHGLEGIEVDHQDHTPHQRERLFELGERLGLIRSGSSDYHGTGKVDHELGCNTTRESAYREILRRIQRRGGFA